MNPTLPREVAPGIHWLASCTILTPKGGPVHSHNSCYLIMGNDKSILIDTGRGAGLETLLAQLDKVLAGRRLDFIMPTHPEAAHCSNLPYLLEHFPEATAVGDVRNCHLFFPEYANRMDGYGPGDELDLGGDTYVFTEGVMHDLPNTLWGYSVRAQVLFSGDGFAFSHSHLADQCALTSEELPSPHPTEQDAFGVALAALYWTRYVDPKILFKRLDELFARYRVSAIAPGHGGFITNPSVVLPILNRGVVLANQPK